MDPAVEAEQIARLDAWRDSRDDARGRGRPRRAAQRRGREGRNIMPRLDRRREGRRHDRRVGRGDARHLRRVPGADRSRPGGKRDGRQPRRGPARRRRRERPLGRRIKLLVGKPGLDGHSNGAEQIAVRARDCGMEVLYQGIRLTPAQIVNAALEEAVHVVGLSILSGSHLALVIEIIERMGNAGLADIPVVVGGIIPEAEPRPCAPPASPASTRRRTSS